MPEVVDTPCKRGRQKHASLADSATCGPAIPVRPAPVHRQRGDREKVHRAHKAVEISERRRYNIYNMNPKREPVVAVDTNSVVYVLRLEPYGRQTGRR